MNWKPIVVGVDGSAESVRAAATGAEIARRAGTACHLVGAVPDYERILLGQGYVPDAGDAARAAMDRDRQVIRASLGAAVSAAVADTLEILPGQPASVLKRAAERLGAGLIVVGSRHHHGLSRLRARIVRHLVRASDVPLLVTDGGTPAISRVLVALDLSWASERTFATAQAWARLFGARLRAVHIVEPAPALVGPTLPLAIRNDIVDAQLRRSGLWERIRTTGHDQVVREGQPAAEIAAEAAEWHAELVVVGSHGSGWTDRLLIGSTAEALVYQPAALTLLVPSGAPADERPLDIGALPWEERVPVASG